jgi:formate hydrogenlyase subunit 4
LCVGEARKAIKTMDWLIRIVTGVVNVGLVLALAPLAEGALRKVTARIQSRQGPPLLQPYLDLLKLLGKEDLEAGTSPRLQRLAACLALASILAVALLVPMGGSGGASGAARLGDAPMGGGADAVLLIYLLTLCGISSLLAALASGSVYALVGMSREMMAMMALEPILAVAVVAGAVKTGSLRLDAVLDGSVYAAGIVPWGGLVLAGVALFALQAFVGRLPFDVAEAETEIMEGPLVEYSGPKLALFKYAQMAKLIVYAALVVSLFAPWGRTGIYPVDLAILLAKVAALVLLVTVVGATHARYRVDQAVRYYALLLAVAGAALALAVCGL